MLWQPQAASLTKALDVGLLIGIDLENKRTPAYRRMQLWRGPSRLLHSWGLLLREQNLTFCLPLKAPV